MMRMYGAYVSIRAKGSISIRALLRRAALAVLLRFGDDGPGLDEHQRAWLIEDSRQYLEALTEDMENGAGIATAQLISTVGATVRWLEGRGASPGKAAIDYLANNLATIYRRPTEHELFQRCTYLAAIGDLGGDEVAASEIWRDPAKQGELGELTEAWAFMGRKIRRLMQDRGMSIRELSERSEIDEVILIPILFGVEELRFEEAMRLGGAMGVEPARFSEGVRFLPNREGTGSVEIDPALDVPEEELLMPGPPAPDDGAGSGR